MKRDVMSNNKYHLEFKDGAVRPVADKGFSVPEIASYRMLKDIQVIVFD